MFVVQGPKPETRTEVQCGTFARAAKVITFVRTFVCKDAQRVERGWSSTRAYTCETDKLSRMVGRESIPKAKTPTMEKDKKSPSSIAKTSVTIRGKSCGWVMEDDMGRISPTPAPRDRLCELYLGLAHDPGCPYPWPLPYP